MEFLLPLFGTLIQLAVVGGIIFLIVRVVSRRKAGPTEPAGVAIGRFFRYLLMLITLVLAGFGIVGLIDAAVSAGAQITRDSAGIALALAFTLVGVPVYTGLALYTARRLRDDPREQESLGWAFYLTVALVGSLVSIMMLGTAVLGGLLVESRIDRLLVIHLVIWSAVWGGHWIAGRRREPGMGGSIHLLLGSAAGLVTIAIGATTFIVAAFQTIYDSLILAVAIDQGAESLVRPLIIVVIGLPVWWWYWLRHSRHGDRTAAWSTYVLLLGVLGGVVLTVSGAGVLLYVVLEWLIGDPSSGSAAAHFASLPDALGAVIVGGVLWLYHAGVLGKRTQRTRTEVDRIYDYLLAGAGLTVATSGVVTLLTVVIDALGGRDITSTSNNTIVAALTLLVVGAPLWWRYWSATTRARHEDPESELRSTTRRIYVLLVLGFAALIAVVDLIVILFLVFEDLLDGSLGRATVGDLSIALGLLLTAGVVAWYHFAVFSEDRADAPEEAASALREVTIVGVGIDAVAADVSQHTGARVHLLHSAGAPTTAGSTEDLIEALRNETHARVIVNSLEDDRFEITPIDD